MTEKDIRGGIYYAIHLYTKASKTYKKVYDRNEEKSYLKYIDRI